MRRATLWAVLGVVGLASSVAADSWFGPRYPYHVYYTPHHRCPYGYKTWGYGITIQTAYGPNSSRAPGVKPFTGPGEYIYAGSMGNYGLVERASASVPQPHARTIAPETIPAGDLPYPTTRPATKQH